MHKTCDQVLDVPVSIELPDGKVWKPRNSGGKDDGLITYYEGLARSKNNVTAYPQKEVVPTKSCNFAEELDLRGTGHRLRAKYKFKNQIGGKTGTTQGNSDGWFMGVTPDLVSGVWVGCDDKRLRFRSTRYGQGANMALPIWAIYMRYVYSDAEIGLSQEPFLAPDGYAMTPYCPAPRKKTFWEPDEDGDVDDVLGLPE